MEAVFSFVDVSLPVPLARSFTYSLPETLRHRAVPGCRIIVPFGSRKLTGMILKAHNQPPEMETREALRLLDEEPVLDAKLLALGRWVAEYYCAPLGEVLRGMAPLAGEVRQSKFWALTDQGHDVVRQLLIGETGNDPAVELLRALETIAAQMLRLDQRENDLVSFDAANFKALRAQELKLQAEIAADKVIKSGIPYAFPPMNSRERRQMHLVFKSIEGVETASSGEGQDRFLAVFPQGKTNLPVAAPVKPRGFGRR